MSKYVHLHNHSHYSLLDGASRIDGLVNKAVENNMDAIALTDHGVMFGAVEFYQKCDAAGVKPIIGVEAYVAPGHRKNKSNLHLKRGETTNHLILLAKNERGYKNLMYLVSMGFLEGFYYKPRMDKELLREYSEGLICTSACLKGEVSFKSNALGYEAAREAALEYREIFGDDYYLEVQNHGIDKEDAAAKTILELSKELSIPAILTNDIHYINRSHSDAHDVLLCLQTGKERNDPKRMRYSTDEIFFKSEAEMSTLFPDHPELLTTTREIADKVDFAIDFDTIHLPDFELPEEDRELDLQEYLEKISHELLRERYSPHEIDDKLIERLDFELNVIKKTGYAGYFLITWDFIRAAREMGIPVGPGRGSAAGSLVAYCLRITNIDPMKYDLLFERFLNPERVSMPDIDIDFCYERREEVIDYVREKYGRNNVAQIITFGTMAARAVVRDVGRVLSIRYADVDRIAKLIPSTLGIKLPDAIAQVQELQDLQDTDPVIKQLMEYSQVLEGLARHSSTHAAGVVITPKALTNYAPLYKPPGSDDITTQFDMKCLEATGVLKMDFLGLRTLTVIQHTLDALKKENIDIDIDNIPLDDPETYKVFGDGQTTAIFQFESNGMREYLRKLKPQTIPDIVAMNALYRPGPMDFIDDFIDRKNGRKKIEYQHEKLEPILKETYGIIVYQEQVMKIASELAGFSLAKADLLRRAMGKKKADLMAKMGKEFIAGAQERGINKKIAQNIFNTMEQFANYGFNKSHAVCYSYVAYQTAYLKSHYPAEFMAATMTSEMGNSDRIVFFINECKNMGIDVLPPDVNVSIARFSVVKGKIRFGMGAIKNVGKGAIESIVAAREEGGPFKNIFDFTQRIDLRASNKKVLESLVKSGAMDSIEGNRNQLLDAIEKAVAYANSLAKEKEKNQANLFDNGDMQNDIAPSLENLEDWEPAEKLALEKELLGFYISGHPLDPYRIEIRSFSTQSINEIEENRKDGQHVSICGMVSGDKIIYDRRNRPMSFITLENFSGSIECLAFADAYAQFRDLIQPEKIIVVQGKISAREEEQPKIIVDRILDLNDAWQELAKGFYINFNIDQLREEYGTQLNQLFRANPGKCKLFFQVKLDENQKQLYCSRKYTIRPNQDLLNRVEGIVGNENVWVDASPSFPRK
ncbi:MAG: DNA polymerase III subunit alpha [Calditrichaeota bacterium]|nr:MAG: DNA polymerase III subunit alpha [Calditrichota bacterium]